MLILTRKIGEAIVVQVNDKTIATVVVCSYDKGKVRLGIEAPQNIKVLRTELIGRAPKKD